jgi:hypothetical protein
MTANDKYIIVETTICCVINALFSFGFAYVVFSGVASVSGQALIVDAIPQSFFVAFFAVFPVTLLTRRRLAKGLITPVRFEQNRLPNNAFVRSVVIGIIVILLAVAGHYVVLAVLYTENVSTGAVLLYKTLYGVALTLVITPYVLKCALAETQQDAPAA